MLLLNKFPLHAITKSLKMYKSFNILYTFVLYDLTPLTPVY